MPSVEPSPGITTTPVTVKSPLPLGPVEGDRVTDAQVEVVRRRATEGDLVGGHGKSPTAHVWRPATPNRVVPDDRCGRVGHPSGRAGIDDERSHVSVAIQLVHQAVRQRVRALITEQGVVVDAVAERFPNETVEAGTEGHRRSDADDDRRDADDRTAHRRPCVRATQEGHTQSGRSCRAGVGGE